MTTPKARTDLFYINGAWVAPQGSAQIDIVNPSTESVIGSVTLGNADDVEAAVTAAADAFPAWSRSTVAERIELLRAIEAEYTRRADDLAEAVHQEMGAPLGFAAGAQVPVGGAHIAQMIDTLQAYDFTEQRNGFSVAKEPVGVVAMITPWNWPLNQISTKVVPALAAGCTMVLKPSEISPINAAIFAEIMDAAGVPAGVFNLIHGDGPTVGAVMSSHPKVDMVSFTGSTRAGVAVAKSAADTVKRVHQELGGKSANIILPDADLENAVTAGVAGCYINAGQSCNAPTRMFVSRDQQDEVSRIAVRAAKGFVPSTQNGNGEQIGPMVSKVQFDKVQALIQAGIDEGAKLETGGVGRPDSVQDGWFVKPTVFSNVTPDMRISREEIFGPVLSILPYDSVEQAVAMANDTEYGLAGYVSGNDPDAVADIANRLRAGTIFVNSPDWTPQMPFGGYKQSGNGREYAEFGLDDYLEIKGIVGQVA
ncbi:aldehyde dehydrogenase [Actibacterium mucosum KCTC 23349]|uniref:aldehyde dehydrogenase (NAD(+)) n=1 Tax=Actibacterium mucosum KCTC 23349 TaxID=1454373 RepID=A0A037ZGQ3_9RHOB|nr:aldehyde dehydrogenase family protein [Actibacterium mucosum]KAJ53960.1 aldehyde dehydrogenase [Actibacterium mucosum KCTC 23349]